MSFRFTSVFILSSLIIIIPIFGCQRLGIQIPGSPNTGASVPSSPPNSPSSCPTGPLTCVDLNWNASPTANVGYHVWYGASSGNYTTKLDAGTALSYQITGLTPGTYYIAVTAYNSTADSSYSNEVSPVIPLTTANDITQKFKEEFVDERHVTIPVGP